MAEDRDIREENLSEQLQRLLMSIEASGRAILPRSNDILLKSIVEAAARIFGAAAASLLLVNEEEEALEFKVAFGPSDQDLVGTKFPYDRGIAGYVFMTGMPIATSNVREDKRFNQDFAKSTGYVPNSILASPLISADDRVIGVMEVLDKIDSTSFTMQDMELMGLFAQQAAMAIDQSQQIDEIQESMVRALKRLAKLDRSKPSPELIAALDRSLEKREEMADLLEIAELFNRVSSLGEAERKACIQILNVFAEYRKTDASPFRFR
ncbi:MAG TPA: GAF domain-containing protein [Anaerolineales bacterium]|nr:GAF domain-containing protein [Anaerolineales bacterium]